jgi:hypothetical protein
MALEIVMRAGRAEGEQKQRTTLQFGKNRKIESYVQHAKKFANFTRFIFKNFKIFLFSKRCSKKR